MTQTDFQHLRVLVDRQHGGGLDFDAWQPIASRVGFTLADKPVTPASLSSADAVLMCMPTHSIAVEVRLAIAEYVRHGGSLLVVLDEECRQSLATTGANDLIRPFGLMYTADTPYLHNCGAIAPAGVIHHALREVPYSGGRAVEGGTAFGWRLDLAGRMAEPYAAYTETRRGGRIVVLAEAMAALLMGAPEGERLSGITRDPSRTIYWGRDSSAFMTDILAWLLRRSGTERMRDSLPE